MLKYFVLTFFGIFAALFSMQFWIGVPQIFREPYARTVVLHTLGRNPRPIEEIDIFAFYFVPQNKIAEAHADWHKLLEGNLRKLKEFHALQTLGRSRINYEIYPEVVVGERDNIFYDTEDTGHGNPKALITAGEEIDRRVFAGAGDLHKENFSRPAGSVYPVMFVLYEGVGASGGVIYEEAGDLTAQDLALKLDLSENVIFPVEILGADGFFMLNRNYFTDPKIDYGASFFAHEFYHTLGFADEYEEERGAPLYADILGGGRFLPLEKTYIRKETLNELSL